MTIHAKNFIAGEWVAASDMTPDINPSNTRRNRRRVPARVAGGCRARHRGGESSLPEVEPVDAAGAL